MNRVGRSGVILLGLLSACAPPDPAKTPPELEVRFWANPKPQDMTPCEPVTDGPVWFQDQDGDCLNASLDCDDTDPDVDGAFTGWQESRCDGKDNNCDGQIDEGAYLSWMIDADGDGYPSETAGACDLPPPWVRVSSTQRSLDCDDADPDIHPDPGGGVEQLGIDVPGDGIDQDCDGADACGPVCTGNCEVEGEDAQAQAKAFCATYAQVDYLEVSYPPATFDFHALDCLCKPVRLLKVSVTDPEVSLAGATALVSELLILRTGAYSSFRFKGMDEVSDLPGELSILSSIDVDLHLDGLKNLTHLGELDASEYGDEYTSLTATDLTGLDSLVTVDGDVYLASWPALTSLHGLESLTSVGGNLFVQGVPALESLRGLDALTSVGGDLYIYSVPVLSDVGALASLRTVGGDVSIVGSLVEDYSALQGLERVGGELGLSGLSASALPTLNPSASFGGLSFYGFQSCDLAQFGHLTELPAGLSLGGLSITSTDGFGELVRTGGLSVSDNQDLLDLSGFQHLGEVSGRVYVGDNPHLTSIEGLSSLVEVGGDLEITNNDSLATLSGLENLTHIGGTLEISGDDRLTQLDALYGIQSVDGSIIIEDNAGLTEEEIYAFLDHLGRENIGLSVRVDAAR